MAYEGNEVPIPLGGLGLQTDGPQSELPPNAAIVANNVSYFQGVLAKDTGSEPYNLNHSLSSKTIVGGYDWWPTPSSQRMIVVTSDGKIWRDNGDKTFTSVTPLQINETQLISFSGVAASGTITWEWNGISATGSNGPTDTAAQVQTKLRTIAGLGSCTVTGAFSSGTPATASSFTVIIPGTSTSQPLITASANSLMTSSSTAVTFTTTHIQPGATNIGATTSDICLVSGGAEVQGNPRRLFFFSQANTPVMITGDASAVTGITRPAADWSSVNPIYGAIYNNRLIALANHNIYISTLADQTDFSTTATDGSGAAVFSVFPGEGDGLISCLVFKGAMVLFKRPFGVYLFTWHGADLTNPANISITRLLDSFALGAPHGASLVLNDMLGGSLTGSIFSLAATNAYGSLEAGDTLNTALVRNYYRQNFDPSGLTAMHSVQYAEKVTAMFTGRAPSSTAQNQILKIEQSGQSPRMSVSTKDQPNCLFLRKDANLVPRPCYGSSDGYVYQMDQTTYDVNGAAYTGEHQTPYLDFSFVDPKLSDKVKLFDFLAVTYQAVGNWSFFVDVYVDGAFIQTLTYAMTQGVGLGAFKLDVNKLGSTVTKTLRKKLASCAGKAISFRVYNGIVGQNFAVERLIVSFRMSGEQARSSKV